MNMRFEQEKFNVIVIKICSKEEISFFVHFEKNMPTKSWPNSSKREYVFTSNSESPFIVVICVLLTHPITIIGISMFCFMWLPAVIPFLEGAKGCA